MNKHGLLTLALLTSALAALSCSIATAQISVSGSAEIHVAPDEVYISAGVETRDSQLDAATHQNDDHVASALVFLKNEGIPEKDIQTDSIQVQPNYSSPSGSWDSSIQPRFYQVRKSIGIKLDNVTNLESVLTGLLSHGVNVLDNVDFRTTELRKYRDQARTLAIKAAKEKAVALCSQLDAKCGKPITINAQDNCGYFMPMGQWGWRNNPMSAYMNSTQNVIQNNGGGGDSGGDTATVSVGQISISATVNVSFAIE